VPPNENEGAAVGVVLPPKAAGLLNEKELDEVVVVEPKEPNPDVVGVVLPPPKENEDVVGAGVIVAAGCEKLKEDVDGLPLLLLKLNEEAAGELVGAEPKDPKEEVEGAVDPKEEVVDPNADGVEVEPNVDVGVVAPPKEKDDVPVVGFAAPKLKDEDGVAV
jgi:hypothetical protein